MKKSKIKVLSLMISVVMAVGCCAPLSVHGQNGGSDGFFRGGYDNYENRDGDEWYVDITNESFDLPLGGGLVTMFAAGLVYTVKKGLKITNKS